MDNIYGISCLALKTTTPQSSCEKAVVFRAVRICNRLAQIRFRTNQEAFQRGGFMCSSASFFIHGFLWQQHGDTGVKFPNAAVDHCPAEVKKTGGLKFNSTVLHRLLHTIKAPSLSALGETVFATSPHPHILANSINSYVPTLLSLVWRFAYSRNTAWRDLSADT